MSGGDSNAAAAENQTINNDSQHPPRRNPNEDYDSKKEDLITPLPKITKRSKNRRRESNYIALNNEETLTLCDADINPTLILTTNTPEQFLADIIENPKK